MPLTLAIRRTIKSTTSLCPVCGRSVRADVVAVDGRVFLDKACPEHGAFSVLINSDERYYYLSKGAGEGGDCCSGSSCCAPASDGLAKPQAEIGAAGETVGVSITSDSLIERSATCIALIELVDSCNLACPTCYAGSPQTHATPVEGVDALSWDEFLGRLASVLARKKTIDILQLSGGEPTIHPRFLDILESVLRDTRIGYVLVNTNGVRLASDVAFSRRLGEMRRSLRKFEVYLQYDGPQEAGQRELRGADLRSLRERAVTRCKELGIPVTLAMTVDADNLAHVFGAVEFALSRRAIRGITFQPRFLSGRIDGEANHFVSATVSGKGASSERGVAVATRDHGKDTPVHVNVGDLVLALAEQSRGLLTDRDFTPLPCGDPNCHTIGYILRRKGEAVPVSRLVDLALVQGFLKDRINFNVEDLARCGCESEPLGALLKAMEIGPDDPLRIFIKPFMDAWTYDQDRIDRCCVHVIGEGGRLESFCQHYAKRSR